MRGVDEHMQLLGHKVTDIVTGFRGVVSSVSFDLYGCIQAVVTPEAVKESNKIEESRWFDVQRLKIVSEEPVLPIPDFDRGYPSLGVKGPATKPPGRR